MTGIPLRSAALIVIGLFAVPAALGQKPLMLQPGAAENKSPTPAGSPEDTDARTALSERFCDFALTLQRAHYSKASLHQE